MKWKDVPGYEGYYQVSDAGDIKSLTRMGWNGRGRYLIEGQMIAPQPCEKGYLAVGLNREGRYRRHLVHRVVMAAFVGPDERQVRHKNGDPADNRLVNLEYGTNAENQVDSVNHGTHYQARKTECKHGHPFNEANTLHYINAKGKPARSCRACHAARERARRASR